MKHLLFALAVLAAQVAPAVPAPQANEMEAPSGIAATAEDTALSAQAWVRVRHYWGSRYHRRRWPPECVAGWDHFYWWGHRYSCYHPSIKRHVHFDRRAGPH
jgi:hypothetical protein